jgi:high-affinity nickel-transport protein
VRKLYYNITITGLSVLVAFGVGTVELVGLIARKVGAQGSFWAWWENLDLNALGLIIVGLFVCVWVLAVAVWRFGRIEQRWGARLADDSSA